MSAEIPHSSSLGILFGKGEENRTPASGFGDQRDTISLHPYFFKTTLSLTLSRSLSLQRHLIAVRRSVVIKKAPNIISAGGLSKITF